MGFIETIKEKVHSLELEEKRTPVWEMLVKLYKENPKDARLASLCMRQMVMYLDELEGDPKWAERERENEYEEYYAFLQEILLHYNTFYADNVEFQWTLCYYLMLYPTFHFILGDTIPCEEAEHIRTKIIGRFMKAVPPLKLFEFIDQLQIGNRCFFSTLDSSEIQELRMEIEALNLQDNYADQDLKELMVITINHMGI